MIIGRVKEKNELMAAYASEYSEFVAIYGRRRVGKTFLVRETFDYRFTFEHSGLAESNLRTQLRAFRDSLVEAGMAKCKIPETWMDAFALLRQLIKQSGDKKKTVFIDEVPWMDTPRSGFVSALEFFWNSFCAARRDVLLIICGSATSWITNKVLRNHGGLHNRVTYRLPLQPFTLHECELFMQSRHINLSRYDLLELYMVMGGVPFYWSMVNRGESVAQCVDRLVFAPDGKLAGEFNELYDSLFKTPDDYIDVVVTLGNNGGGMTRQQLVNACHMAGNGKTTRILDDLQQCGFIKRVTSAGLKNQAVFLLIDNFTLFYLKFVRANNAGDPNFWTHSYLSATHSAWTGLAFERVCFQHVQQIKQALGIAGVRTNVYTWRTGPAAGHRGAQIDMLIDRADNMVNICEMKFSKQDYVLERDEAMSLANKAERFLEGPGRGKSLNITLVTVNGLKHTGYWSDIHQVVTANDLFKE